MASAEAPPQVFVRTEKGQTFGPLPPSTVELLVDNGTLQGRFQVSLDGERYADPGSLVEVRDSFPRTLWQGDSDAARATTVTAPASAPRRAPPPMLSPTLSPAGPPPGPVKLSPAPPTRLTPVPSAPAAPTPASAAIEVPGIAPRGDLSAVSALKLYALASAADVTGLFEFTLVDRTVSVHFRKGNAELVSSNHPEDGVGAYLVAQRLLKDEQLQQAQAALGRFGGDVTAALFGLGILNPGNAFAPLAQRATGIMSKVLVASGGTYTFEARELSASKVLPLGNRWSVLADLLRRLPIPELRRRMQDVFELPVVKSGGWVNVSDLRLTPQETRALSYFDGVRALSKLVQEHPSDADNLVRLGLLLREVDGVSFSKLAIRLDAPPEAARAPPPATATRPAAAPAAAVATSRPSGPRPAAPPTLAPSAAAPPADAPKPELLLSLDDVLGIASGNVEPGVTVGVVTGAPIPRAPATSTARPATVRVADPVLLTAPPVDPEVELAQVRARAVSIKKENFFQVLGLPETTDATAVKMAYFRLAKIYHPDTVAPGAPPDMQKLKAEVFSVVGEAYRRLQDDKNRAEYLLDLKAGGASELDIAKILRAEDLFQKGTILVRARKYPEAVKMLEEAIQSNPDEPEFYAWRGYATFCLSADKKTAAVEAVKEIQKALARNPRCAPAHFFLGNISKLLGDVPGAMKHFKRTVELDVHHIDALRELRGPPKR